MSPLLIQIPDRDAFNYLPIFGIERRSGYLIYDYLILGQFIQNIVDFIIIAFCIFLMIKGIMKLKKKKEEAPAAPAAPSKEEVLLTEIRDLLKEKK